MFIVSFKKYVPDVFLCIAILETSLSSQSLALVLTTEQNYQEREHPNNTSMQKVALVNTQQTHSEKPRLRDRTDRTWFSCSV